ncbi:MAG: hypothetical protein WB676_24795 [Bryobacteraceae bacterium]
MPKEQTRKSSAQNVGHDKTDGRPVGTAQKVSAAELMSYLKEAGGVRTWTEKALATTLKLSPSQAKEATAALQLQGYIEPVSNTGKWRVSEQGDLVSGAKPPRYTRKSVEGALAGLRDRIKVANDDPDAAYKIAEAVAFGDFLGDAARVQAAEVGIRLVPTSEAATTASAKEHAAELEFLKQLRGKTALLHIVTYENWMGSRSHVRLL